MDFRYLLFVERAARDDVLEHLAGMSVPSSDGPTTLVLPDRTVTLPFGAWSGTSPRVSWDDPSPTWEFTTVLCFEPDEAIEEYLDRVNRRERSDADSRLVEYDERRRATIGFIYLTVHNDMSEWPSGTADDLVLFELGTPGTTMSVLFTESASIRQAFVGVLESCRGVYGLLDREDPADLIWLRGEERDDELPTASMTLADIEDHVAPAAPAAAFTFAAEAVIAAARHARRSAGGAELGVHHWLLAALDADVSVPARLGGTDPSEAREELRRRLERGEIGAPLSEGDVRELAGRRARRGGEGRLVTADDVAGVVVDAAGDVEL